MDELVKKASKELLNRASGTYSVAPRAKARALWLSEDTYASVLITMLLDTYPETDEHGRLEVLQWSPQTIKEQIEEDFSLKLPNESFGKLMAAITVLTTNQFYKSPRKFIELCNVFSGDTFHPAYFEPADAAEIFWGVTEALLLNPPDDDPEDTEFSPEVLGYIREQLREEGIMDPPEMLRLGRDPDAASKISTAFSDDPEMFGAIWKTQKGKSAELREMLKDNLKEMAMQFKLLSLQNGKTDGIVEQILRMVGSLPASEEQDTI